MLLPKIDVQPIVDRLRQLRESYDTFNASSPMNSRRIFHGRGRCYPGLEFVCVDFFQPVLLVTLYDEPQLNNAKSNSADCWLAEFLNQINPWLSPVISTVVVQRRYEPGAPTTTIWGEMPAKVYARRDALRFQLPIAQQQNSGYFLDMEPGRQWLERHAAGKRILNLFAYTCAFSVVAVAAGAERVVNVDMSGRALQIGRQHHHKNGLDKRSSEFLAENIFKSWGRIKRRGPYDLVIIDPPSYQPGSFVASKDYARVVRRIPELMPGGGVVLACLNAPELSADFLLSIFKEVCMDCAFEQRLKPSCDFPDVDPEQQLKLLVFRYEPDAG